MVGLVPLFPFLVWFDLVTAVSVNNRTSIFIVLLSSSRDCESSLRSSDECRSVPGGATFRPSQLTWAVSLPVGCHSPHPPTHHSVSQPTESRRLSLPSWVVTYRDVYLPLDGKGKHALGIAVLHKNLTPEALRHGTHHIWSHSFTCTPTHLSTNGMNYAFAFTAKAGPHFTNPWIDLVAWLYI